MPTEPEAEFTWMCHVLSLRSKGCWVFELSGKIRDVSTGELVAFHEEMSCCEYCLGFTLHFAVYHIQSFFLPVSSCFLAV